MTITADYPQPTDDAVRPPSETAQRPRLGSLTAAEIQAARLALARRFGDVR